MHDHNFCFCCEVPILPEVFLEALGSKKVPKIQNMKVVIPSSYREKKEVFWTPRASNGLMIKPFELGGLQMILSEPPMFRIWQKLVKNAHFFIKYKLFIEKKHDFLLQKLNFFRI